MRNASCQQGENERDQVPKKANRNTSNIFFLVPTYDISSATKRVTRKFHFVVVQQQR